ncbi:MAG: tetratricopeptide repeat protein [Magnetococcales bacterium]|nr:tetratricopeptide repeat protein [Magnetococcales bacterium]
MPRLTEADRQQSQIFMERGDRCRASGQVDEAISYYQQALDQNPADVMALMQLGALFFGQQKINEAERYYRRALTLVPSSGNMNHNLATVLESNGKIEEAIDYYVFSVNLNPQNITFYLNLAAAYSRHGYRDKAEACYRRALTVTSDSVEVWSRLGFILGQQERVDEAKECFQRAFDLQPGHAETRLYLHNLHSVQPTEQGIRNRSNLLLLNSNSDDKAQIYDCFTFFDEFDMLDIRLHHLWDYVDRFVLVEADHTHRGQPKEFIFDKNKERFSWASSKIIHVKANLSVAGRNFSRSSALNERDDNWKTEHDQRNAIMEGLRSARDDDLILISDLDEIPSHAAMRGLRKIASCIPAFNLRFHLHIGFLDFHATPGFEVPGPFGSLSLDNYPGTTVCRRKNLWPQAVRSRIFTYPARFNSGYHFSGLGGISRLIKKSSYSAHSELDTDLNKDPKYVADSLKRGYCIKYNIHDDINYPVWIKQNKALYDHLFYSEEALRAYTV